MATVSYIACFLVYGLARFFNDPVSMTELSPIFFRLKKKRIAHVWVARTTRCPGATAQETFVHL